MLIVCKSNFGKFRSCCIAKAERKSVGIFYVHSVNMSIVFADIPVGSLLASVRKTC